MIASTAFSESADKRLASAAVRFSSCEWPEAERRDRLRDVFGRTITRLDFEPSPQCPLNIEAKFRTLPGLGIAYIATSATRVRRTPIHLASDDLILSVNLAGDRAHSQCGRDVHVREGEAILTAGAEISKTEIFKSRYITFRLPRKPISALVTDLDDCVARPIRRDTEALRLLVNYAGALEETQVLAEPALHRIAVTHIHDLAALVLGATRDATEIAKVRGARAARLRAVKADIVDNLGHADISVAAVAARHHLPVRSLQRLFEAEGGTFTDFVLGARLARAHRMLVEPRMDSLKISAIASEAGFGDMSYFNQSFRRRYGATPSDVRAQARPDR